LKKLAHSFMILNTDDNTFIPDVNLISKRAGQWVERNFSGNYKSANDFVWNYSKKFFSGKALHKLSPHQKKVLINFMICIAIDKNRKWSIKDKEELWKLILNKASGPENNYIISLTRLAKLFE